MNTASPTKPIFFDPTGVRRFAVVAAGWVLFAVICMVAASLCFATIVDTVSSPVQLQGKQRAVSPGVQTQQEPENLPVFAAPVSDVNTEKVPNMTRYAHLITWDDNSFSALKANASKLDVVIAEWLTIAHPERTLTSIDPLKEAATQHWVEQNAPGLKIYPYLSNYSQSDRAWDAAAIADILNSDGLRRAFIRQVSSYLDAGRYQGLVVNFEQIAPSDRLRLTQLVRELADELHSKGRALVVEVTVGDPVYDEAAIAAAADGISITLFDEHGEDETSGPIASYGWFMHELNRAVAAIPRNKIIAGVGSYGYDWTVQKDGHEISVQEAWELLAESRAPLTFSRNTLNPSFTYVDDEDHAQHEVTFLDAVTFHNQLSALQKQNVAGVALWRLGTEDPAIWSEFARGKNASADGLAALEVLNTGYDVLYTGTGEVMQVDGSPKPGARQLKLDPSGTIIIEEKIISLPRSTVVKRFGSDDDKMLALTFDDGPSANYTPQILDVLAEKKVKATFFVVGSAALVNSDILRRIYAEGHDIGNHTFNHLNTGLASVDRLRYELNSTQSLLKSTIGVGTTLFRPPYAEDIEPKTIDAAATLRTAGELGYLSVGMNIDPNDWYRQIPDQIVNSTVSAARAHNGSIILLHDAGGPRSATVAALPRIIDMLQADGYKFVSVHELLGLSRADVMQPVTAAGKWEVLLNFIGFTGIRLFEEISVALFVLGVTLGMWRAVALGVLGCLHKQRERARAELSWTPPSVTAILPAYNERGVVFKSVQSLLASTGVNLRIVVVDDGSSDGTAEVASKAFADDDRVKVITKENGGKWSALNLGLASTDDDIIVTLDADTIFAPDAVRLLVRHFADPSVAAVAGHAMIGNTINLITRFQALEYMTNQNLDRRALEVLNGITVVPGAIGAWRRTALLGIDGFASDTLAEDADATVRLGIAGWKVISEPKAVAITEAPETISQFMRQRHRWMYGTLQVVVKNSRAIFRRKPTGVGLYGLPNILIFQFLLTLTAPVADLMLVWSIFSSFTTAATSTEVTLGLSLGTVAIYWAGFQTIEIAAAALAIWLDERDRPWHLLGLLLLQRFCYRQLLYVTAIRVTIAAMKGTLQSWGKLNRTGNVKFDFHGEPSLKPLAP